MGRNIVTENCLLLTSHLAKQHISTEQAVYFIHGDKIMITNTQKSVTEGM